MPDDTGGQLPPAGLERERERTIESLSQHFAQDDINVEELERRLEVATRAKGVAELRALLADLDPSMGLAPIVAGTPVRPTPAVPMAVPARDRVVSIMGETKRRGAWSVPHHLDVTAVMSDTTIDLTQATLPVGAIELHLRVVMAQVKIIVPPGVTVDCRVSAFMGAVTEDVELGDQPRPGAPVVRLTGWAVMSEVQVKVRRLELNG